MIDFRSDTVTTPTHAMREAMLLANVGDDVYQDDPTVIELENYAAELFRKEAALFVPSGTFSNQLAIMTHCRRGDEIIVEEHAHIKVYEAGAVAGLSGVNMMSVPSVNGQMSLSRIESAIRGDDVHYPDTSLICIENAYNGMALPLSYMKEVKDIANKHGIKTHLDGARVCNAAVALECELYDIGQYFDSISVCLSKGLGAPIGSVLVGDKEFIERARRYRKMMGGGLRQVGVLAAPGLIALKEMRLRLKEDHDLAKYLAEELSKIPSVTVETDKLDINMVFISINHKENVEKYLEENGILISGYQKDLRLAIHHQISKDDVDLLLKLMKEVLV